MYLCRLCQRCALLHISIYSPLQAFVELRILVRGSGWCNVGSRLCWLEYVVAVYVVE